MRVIGLVLATTGVLGAPRAARAQAARPPETCRSRIETLRARLDAAQTLPRSLGRPPEGVRIPVTAAGDRIDSTGPSGQLAPVLVISAGGDLSLDGRLVDGATVAEQAAAIRRDRVGSGRGVAGELLVWVDADLPARSVLPLFEALGRDGTSRLLVQIDTTPARSPPAPPWLADALRRAEQALDPVENATMFESALSRSVGTCSAIGRRLAAHPTTTDRWQALTTAVLEGLGDCNCQGADLEALGALLAAIGGSGGRPLRSLPLRPSAESGAVAVSLAREATIEDLVRAIGNLGQADRARPVRIEWESRR